MPWGLVPCGGVFLCSRCQLKPNPSFQELYRCKLNQEFSLIQGKGEEKIWAATRRTTGTLWWY